MPVEQLRELQLDRMKRSFAHAYENIPLYRERFAEAGVVPSDLKSLDDLVKFPFLTKQDMRDSYPFGLFAVPQGDVARIHAPPARLARQRSSATPPTTSRTGASASRAASTWSAAAATR